MTLTDRLTKTLRAKQEFGKPQPTCDLFACQTHAFLPTLGLVTLTVFGFLNNGWTQNQTPTPTFPNYQQVWTPNQNNNLTPRAPQTNFSPATGTNQYERDKQELSYRQQQLETIYRELEQPNKVNVKYDLPSCSGVQGASSFRDAFSELSRMANGERAFDIKKANFLIENAFYDNHGQFENFDLVIKQIGQFLKWKMEESNYNANSNLAKNLILYQFFADTLEIKSKKLKHLPFKYDFEDYMGHENWSKMFVEKALASNSGQCHSLPLLYINNCKRDWRKSTTILFT